MTLYDIVKKLAGPTRPLGDSGQDPRRLENLKMVTGLVEELIVDLYQIAGSAESQEASVAAIGKHARGFLEGLKEWS